MSSIGRHACRCYPQADDLFRGPEWVALTSEHVASMRAESDNRVIMAKIDGKIEAITLWNVENDVKRRIRACRDSEIGFVYCMRNTDGKCTRVRMSLGPPRNGVMRYGDDIIYVLARHHASMQRDCKCAIYPLYCHVDVSVRSVKKWWRTWKRACKCETIDDLRVYMWLCLRAIRDASPWAQSALCKDVIGVIHRHIFTI